jgi:hypothetical protein
MKKLFTGASGLFAATPGIAIILKGIGTPPGYNYLFGGVIEALGGLCIIILWVNKGKIKRLPIRKITRVAIILGLVSFASLILYIGLFKFCVISHPAHGTVYYPLWTSGRIAELVGRTGGRWEALDRYGITPIYNAISQMPAYAITITTALLLFVYQAIFTSLAIAFGLIGFRGGRDL